MITEPLNTSWKTGGTLSRFRALLIIPTSTTPMNVPWMVPEPPLMFVPPRITDATASNRRLIPARFEATKATREMMTIAAIPMHTPERI